MTEIVFGGDSADIPPGTYEAELLEIETLNSAQYGDFRKWRFALTNGSTVDGATSMSDNARSKAGKWIIAILGRIPTKGEKVNPVGGKCLVQVIENSDGWPKVENVLPPMAAGSPTAKPEAPSAPVAVGVAPKTVIVNEVPF